MDYRRFVLIVSALVLATPRSGLAQQRQRWEILGFDFHRDGAWRVRARQVAAVRAQLLGQGRFDALNAPVAAGVSWPSAQAVSGTLKEPAVLFRYKDTDPSQLRDTAQYNAVLFSTPPPGGNPYTLRTFYEQLSNNLFSLQGQTFGYAALDSNEVWYTGAPGSCTNPPNNNCNGLFSSAAFSAMQAGLTEALVKLDGTGTVNWGQFDNDGLDGTPNSGDDDGFVDVAIFLPPTRGGECGGATNNHLWAHRSQLSTPFTTSTPRSGSGFIVVRDYILQSAVGGGVGGCDSTQIMAIGTAGHESGHALGLPDLYDVSNATEGVGQWGLMGSGNYTSANSPSRMEAWSLQQLGWITVRPLTVTGTYSLGAVPTADTALVIRPQGANPRGESFLLENRQASLADTAMIRIHCGVSGNPPGCGGGLLIWQIDSTKITDGSPTNQVNAGTPQGVALIQADGLNHLRNTSPPQNRGDAGDPYPGTTGNKSFSFSTTPAAVKNSDGSFVGFAIDSIRQVVLAGEMAFRLRFGGPTVVRASDTTAIVQVDAANYTVFRDVFEDASNHTIGVADTQFTNSNRTRHVFTSWSDAGARVHTVVGTLAGATYTATLQRAQKLIATAGAGGTVSSTPALNLAGDFVDENTSVTVTATPNSGFIFGGWTGDTTASAASVTLPMARPYTLTANFLAQLAITSAAARRNGVMGAPYADTLRAAGGTGSYLWAVTGGALPTGVNMDPSMGILSGFPQTTGNVSYLARATSGTQVQTQTFTFSVTAPTLATANVVAQILGQGAPLNADQLRYLDFLGNNNGGFDVGDFLAWVVATGAPVDAAAVAGQVAKEAQP